jgi:hypothetical protein
LIAIDSRPLPRSPSRASALTPTGLHAPAHDNALGNGSHRQPAALKGRNESPTGCSVALTPNVRWRKQRRTLAPSLRSHWPGRQCHPVGSSSGSDKCTCRTGPHAYPQKKVINNQYLNCPRDVHANSATSPQIMVAHPATIPPIRFILGSL